jgi:hypothetical protein
MREIDLARYEISLQSGTSREHRVTVTEKLTARPTAVACQSLYYP